MTQPQRTDAFEELPSRYIVGIDLGTTNCAVAYVDTDQPQSGIRNLPIEQWVDFGTQEKRRLLPSFHYQPLPDEATTLSAAGASQVEYVVGSLARDRGLQLPGRQVASAKSWLCHAGVDRQGPILPWQADDGVEPISPVTASARYLERIRQAWDQLHPQAPLEEQDIVLTLPASFDQVARQLTIEAAREAGLPRVLPIEEPQAAFYAWLSRHRDSWESMVQPQQTILVCDIGGGTTDFTLIRVRAAAAADAPTVNELDQQRLSLHRVAVGQHLILGGDNIDLALAKFAEHKLTGGQTLPARSWDALRQACRVAKEVLLGDMPPATYQIHLPGSGSRLIGGGAQVELTAAEVQQCVLDGFFPDCQLGDRPEAGQTGFQEFGLPFAAEARITRHLAAFLWDHRRDGRTDEELQDWDDARLARPDWVLFNGGVMTSSQIRHRLLDSVGSWFRDAHDSNSDWRPAELAGESLELAVAVGAAYFGRVRRGEGVAIEAKLACSYYLQTSHDPPQAVCIVPGSASPGDRFSLADRPLQLAIGQPVQFPVWYSSTRLADRVGCCVDINPEQMAQLPPIRTVLELSGSRRRETLPVVIDVELSQIGTLQMWCQATTSAQRWKLEFDVRGSTQSDWTAADMAANTAGILDDQAEASVRRVLEDVFGKSPQTKPAKLVQVLSEALQLSRSQWPPSLLRTIWQVLLELDAGRKQSAAHEARWLNLLGYALRPGYGMAADDWRVAETWRRVQGQLAFASVSSRNESLILWRRIAGGFTAGQQLAVYQQIAGPLRGVLDPVRRAKGGGGLTANELTELLRLVGSLELLPKHDKQLVGDWLLSLLHVKKWAACQSAVLWTVGRLGTRVPSYGPLNSVLDSHIVTGWLERLLERPAQDPNGNLAIMLLARRVHDRYRDLAPELRLRAADYLESSGAPPHYASLVRDGGRLEEEEANQILGESLPLGLQMRSTEF